MYKYQPPGSPPVLLRSFWPDGVSPSRSLIGAMRRAGNEHAIYAAPEEDAAGNSIVLAARRAGPNAAWLLGPNVTAVAPVTFESNVRGGATVTIDPKQLPIGVNDSVEDSAASLTVAVARSLEVSHPGLHLEFYLDSNPRGQPVRVSEFALDNSAYGPDDAALDLFGQALMEVREGVDEAVTALLRDPSWRVARAVEDAPEERPQECVGALCRR